MEEFDKPVKNELLVGCVVWERESELLPVIIDCKGRVFPGF